MLLYATNVDDDDGGGITNKIRGDLEFPQSRSDRELGMAWK